MPVASAAQQVVQALIGNGYTDVDFAALIAQQAKASGLAARVRGGAGLGRAGARGVTSGPAGTTVDTEAPAAYLERYGRMLLIRLFETEMQRLFLKGEVHGTTHLCAGQEAVPVGVCSALEPDD